MVGAGRPLATGPPFVYEPLLSVRACESPFCVLFAGDLGPADLEDPFVKCCGGELGRFEASLSKRIVPSSLRLRLAVWREGRPAVRRVAGPSSASSLSEMLCLRFPVAVRGDRCVEVVVGSCAGALAAVALSSLVVWAESTGEGEAGGIGGAGRSEAIRGGGIGVVSSARTNAGRGYPQVTLGVDGGGAVPGIGVVFWIRKGPSGVEEAGACKRRLPAQSARGSGRDQRREAWEVWRL